MCVRMCPLAFEEAEAALASLRVNGRATVPPDGDRLDPLYDARPGAIVPVFVSDADGGLQVAKLSWGFPLESKSHAVFNTRIESALSQLRGGRRGMWADAIAHGRCLVSVRAFYEGRATERVASEPTGKPVRRQYRFRMPGVCAFLLAGIQRDGRFSIVATEPNASVAPRPRPHAARSRLWRIKHLARPRLHAARRQKSPRPHDRAGAVSEALR